jgi:glutamate-1-semialdehyde 2,1-aminomutase
MLTIHPVVGEIDKPEDADKADRRLRRLLYLDLLDEGIYIAERGFIALSLEIAETESAKLLAALQNFLTRRRSLLLT